MGESLSPVGRSQSLSDCRRGEQVTAAMAARQEKREDNLAMRSEIIKDKKGGRAKARPGFKGKRFHEHLSRKIL